jgi:hypothetical protein
MITARQFLELSPNDQIRVALDMTSEEVEQLQDLIVEHFEKRRKKAKWHAVEFASRGDE